MKKFNITLTVFIATILCALQSYAGVNTLNHHIQKAAIVAGVKMDITDPTWADEQANPINYAITRTNKVRLAYDRSAFTDVATGSAWTYEVRYNIYRLSNPTDSIVDTLRVSYASGDYVYEAINVHDDHPDVALEVLSVASTGTPPTDIRLELLLETDWHIFLGTSETPLIGFDTTNSEIYWEFIPGAEEYDVEWVFIDSAANPNVAFTTSNPEAPFEYKEPTRVRTSWQKHKIDLTYPAGKLYFRVRAVGRHIKNLTDYSHIRTADWGYWENPNPSSVVTYEIEDSKKFETNKNWTYQIGFAEDGKRKAAVSYFDGSSRNRQALTHVSSDNTTIIGESKYDYEGRAAVNILPTPVAGIDLSYRSEFNVIDSAASGTNVPFEALYFDTLGLCTTDTMFALATDTGAAQYYSSNNNFDDNPFQNYIPDAGGYVYTQTQFTRDGTGRVARATSGLGQDFALGAGHESRMFYCNTNATELQRLFGSNVGNPAHYQKYMSVDANGQVAISYTDQAERTIATALAGPAPDNLMQLESYSVDTLITNLALNNVYDAADHEMLSVNVHANPVPNTSYTFHYDMRGVIYNDSVLTPGDTIWTPYCDDCEYELEIVITDPCGKIVQIPDPTNVDTLTRYYTNPNALNCSHTGYNSASALDVDFSVTFTDIGDYKITKVLRTVVNIDSIGPLVDSTLVDMGITLQGMIDSFQNMVDTTMCDFTCEDHCLSIVLEENPMWAADQAFYADSIQTHVAQCAIDTCDDFTNELYGDTTISYTCNSLLEMIKKQISPTGGDDGTGGYFYNDDDFLLDNKSVLPAPYDTASLASIIRDNWQSGWDALYAPYHREYCHYQSCQWNVQANNFNLEMNQIQDWVEAEATGWLDPAKMTDDSTGLSVHPNYLADNDRDPIVFYPYTNNVDSNRLEALSHRMIRFNLYSAPCTSNTLGSEYTIWEYTDSIKNPCIWDSIAYTDTSRWELFYSLYMHQKQELLWEIDGDSSCTYYDDPIAIVPELPWGTIDSTGVDSLNNIALDQMLNCNMTCQSNVQLWINRLDTACYNSLDSTETANLEAALYDFCINECDFDNPYGLMLADVDTTTNHWIHLDTTMTNLGCNLDSIVVNNPYSTCDTTVVTYINECFEEILYYFRDSILTNYDTMSCYNITGLLPHCAGNRYLWVTNGHNELRIHNSCNTAAGCSGMRLYDPYGTLLDFRDIVGMSNWVYAPTSGVSSPPGGQLYRQIRTTVVYADSTFYAYVYGAKFDACIPSIVTDTFCLPSGMSDAWTAPTVNLDTLQQNCIDELMADAEFDATNAYNAIVDSIETALLNNLAEHCIDTALNENYTMRYPLSEYHYTLFYYDQAGNLVQTVPPLGVNPVASTAFNTTTGLWDGTTEPSHTHKTRYAFNSANQIIESETPDGGLSKMWYNDNYQVRFAQNAEQAADGHFTYTKFDVQGRPVEVGESGDTLTGGCSNTDFRNSANDMTFPDVSRAWEVTQTYYDTVFDATMATHFGGEQENLRSRVSSTVYRPGTPGLCTQDSTRPYLASHYSYDQHGNVKTLVQQNSMLEHLYHDIKTINYDYDLVSGNVNEVTYQQGELDQYKHRYEYDADNRITNTWTSRDDELWEQDCKNFYYLHGPLARMETGHDKIQAGDYVYTINGWLKTVNGATLMAEREMGADGVSRKSTNNGLNSLVGRDAMAFSLGYFEGDYTGIGAPTSMLATISGTFSDSIYDLFNGNIGHMTTAMMDLGDTVNAVPTFGTAYRYDQLQRIKQMTAFSHVASNIDEVRDDNSFANATKGNDQYATTYKYDANGNITNLTRNNGSGTAFDRFIYNYTATNNQLEHVDDAAGSGIETTDIDDQSANNYLYDEIGQLLTDTAEQIDTILWNHAGKIQKVIFSAASSKDDLEFIYGPDGQRLAKLVNEGYNQTATFYVRDASGNVMATYKKDFTEVVTDEYDEKLRLNDHHLYASKRLGTDGASHLLYTRNFTVSGGNETNQDSTEATNDDLGFYTRLMGEKTYECSNHLGNVLVTLNDRKLGVDSVTSGSVDHYLADVTSYSDYYPFGMQMPGRHGNTGDYRYGFQGEETDDEWTGTESHVSFTYRCYDARLGRFLSLDPLAPDYPHNSPYAFSENRVIDAIELEGLESQELNAPPLGMIMVKTGHDAVVNSGLTIDDVIEGMLWPGNVILDFIEAEAARATGTAPPVALVDSDDVPFPETDTDPDPDSQKKPDPKPVAVGDDEEYITLYRGVGNVVNPEQIFDLAKRGVAYPKGLLTADPHDDADLHSAGDNYTLWTSWTDDEAYARENFMKAFGSTEGVVLEITVKKSETTQGEYSVGQDGEYLLYGVKIADDKKEYKQVNGVWVEQ